MHWYDVISAQILSIRASGELDRECGVGKDFKEGVAFTVQTICNPTNIHSNLIFDEHRDFYPELSKLAPNNVAKIIRFKPELGKFECFCL